MKLKITVFKIRMPHNQCVAILLRKYLLLDIKHLRMTSEELEKVLKKYIKFPSQYREENLFNKFSEEEINNHLNSLNEKVFDSLTDYLEYLKVKLENKKDRLKERNFSKSEIDEKTKDLRDEIKLVTESFKDLDEIIQYVKNDEEKNIKTSAINHVFDVITKGQSKVVKKMGGEIKIFGDAIKKAYPSLTLFGNAIGRYGKFLENHANGIGLINRVTKGAGSALGVVNQGFGIYADYMRASNEISLKEQSAGIKLQQQKLDAASQIQQASGELAQNQVGVWGALGLEGKKLGFDAYVNANEMAAKAPFDIKGAAYGAANAAIDLAAGKDTFNIHEGVAQKKANYFQESYDNKVNQIQKNLEADQKQTIDTTNKELDYLNEKRSTNLQTSTNSAIGNLLSGIELFGFSAGDLPKGIADLANTSLNYDLMMKEYNKNRDIAEINRETMIKKFEINYDALRKNQEIQLGQTKLDYATQEKEAIVNAATQIKKAWMNMAQELNDRYLKMQDASTKMGRSMGYGGEGLRSYNYAMLDMQANIAQFGKDLEWMSKQQISYQESTGRNKLFDRDDFKTSAVNDLLMGEDVVAPFNAGMEIFNASVTTSNAKLNKMFNEVSKIGLNGKKYAKDLVNNLKLAEKYNFKNGVNSLMQMVKWAQNVRFNMGNLDGMLDNIQSGGLENLIEKSASLQVLGGDFAMGADPLAMGWEAFKDPEAFAKRVSGMVANTAHFDKNTGEYQVGSITDMIRLRTASNVLGIDYKDLLNQVKQLAKIKDINGIIGANSGLTEDQKSLITNKAEYDPTLGSFVVKYKNANGKVDKIGVNDINSQNIGLIENGVQGLDPNAATNEIVSKMYEVMPTLMSQEEQRKASETFMQSTLMADLKQYLEIANDQMTSIMLQKFKDEYNDYFNKTATNLLTIATATNNFWELYNKEEPQIKGALDNLNKTLGDLTGAINKMNGEADNYSKKAQNVTVQGPKTGAEAANNIKNNQEFHKARDVAKENVDEKYKELNNVKQRKEGYFGNFVKGQDIATARAKYDWAQGDLNFSRGNIMKGLLYKYKGGYDQITYRLHNAIANIFGVDDFNGVNSIFDKIIQDGIIDKNGRPKSINDGYVTQNGLTTKIDSNDQVLAAKKDGPIDKMLDSVSSFSNPVSPRPMSYNSQVMESPHRSQSQKTDNGKLEVAPIQININGSIKVNGNGGSTDITRELTNNPEFVRSIAQIISIEVEKKVQGGRVVDPINRGLVY